jgi:hypothetical protein
LELVASVFASCLNYLEEKFKDILPIIIYSDGCTNQNLDARTNKPMIQKFLEKRHTLMEMQDEETNCLSPN